MPDPLPSDIVARLRSDSTAALAASLILAGSFPDIVSWVLSAFSVKDSEPKASVPANEEGKSRHAPRPQSAVKSDQALLALARQSWRKPRRPHPAGAAAAAESASPRWCSARKPERKRQWRQAPKQAAPREPSQARDRHVGEEYAKTYARSSLAVLLVQ